MYISGNFRGTRKLFKVFAIINNQSHNFYITQSTLNTDRIKISIRTFMNQHFNKFGGQTNESFNGVQVDLLNIEQLTPLAENNIGTYFIDE